MPGSHHSELVRANSAAGATELAAVERAGQLATPTARQQLSIDLGHAAIVTILRFVVVDPRVTGGASRAKAAASAATPTMASRRPTAPDSTPSVVFR